MTAPAGPATAAETTSTPVGPAAGERLRSARRPVIVVGLVLLAGILVALVSGAPRSGTLRPDATDQDGSRALATLLADQGVGVTTVGDEPESPEADRTVLVAAPAFLSTAQRDALARTRADVVLVEPDSATLDALAPGVRADTSALPEPETPACALPAAQAAGPVDLQSIVYTVPPGAVGCYPVRSGASLVVLAPPPDRAATGHTVTVVGDRTPFTNAALDQRGNAALTMRLLGAHHQLHWYLPRPAPGAAGQHRSLRELIPAGWVWAAGMLLLAAGVAVLWRARRLGPLVDEALPVVVRADETVRGRARIYRRVGARDRAAGVLRDDARRDLARWVGVPSSAPAPVLVDAVAARTGRPAPEVAALLVGDPPRDDPALVALATDLDLLVGAVHRA